MNDSTWAHWQEEFAGTGRDGFLAAVTDRDPLSGIPQAHVIRRAFDALHLDGVLHGKNAALAYFKEVAHIDNAEVAELHRKFWNLGGAPILVVISPTDVHIYSGLVRPVEHMTGAGRIPAFVTSIDQVSAGLAEFRLAVESGAFIRRHAPAFDPVHRVDKDLLRNLSATRERLLGPTLPRADPKHAHREKLASVLDALLCRLVFTSYLFDRGVIDAHYVEERAGLSGANRLVDILSAKPRTTARDNLFRLFGALADEFNGDLFGDDIQSEAHLVTEQHVELLEDFFRGTDENRQPSFWPYDFSAIPIETISAIYERFIGQRRKQGALYTPRFLAELVLDLALAPLPTLLNQRFLDPACGSGIFLVGLFNRIAQEWRQKNSTASNDEKARALRKILCQHLYGVDVSRTACRITAFSLYLAYLDQLSPRHIRRLQDAGHWLPKLLQQPEGPCGSEVEGNIRCSDFFSPEADYATDADLVIGNPPWAKTATRGSLAARWCSEHGISDIPDKQIAAAFAWKAPKHARTGGRVCLLLPHGLLFNRSDTARRYQGDFLKRHAVNHVLDLTDHQRILFEGSEHPAIMIAYRPTPPAAGHRLQYLAPKADWFATQSEIIAVYPDDTKDFAIADLLSDLDRPHRPLVWARTWATRRDQRLIDRLTAYPRLMSHVRRIDESALGKPWVVSAGFRPPGASDDPDQVETIDLPSLHFIETTSKAIDLFVNPSDCRTLDTPTYVVRKRSNKATDAFGSPHVLIKEGFSGIAYADFDVSFLQSLRAISGPRDDRRLLMFLAAYLRSPLARYYLFHTSSSWGISRQRVGLDELLQLPFPLPKTLPDSARATDIIAEVAGIMEATMTQATSHFADRQYLVGAATSDIQPLLDEYFDLLPEEKILIEDTMSVVAPSTRPTHSRANLPTAQPSSRNGRDGYVTQVCSTLNGWAPDNGFEVRGRVLASEALGVGIALLERARIGSTSSPQAWYDANVLASLARLQTSAASPLNNIEMIRGAKIFHGDLLYVVKPIGARFWTRTAALNDADEIAGAILATGGPATA